MHKKQEAVIEGILFAMGESVKVASLAEALEISGEEVRELVGQMAKRYAREDSGIQIIEVEDAIQMCTKKEIYEYLIKIARQPKRHALTDVLLETLSIIAYKQPITRLEVEKIRGRYGWRGGRTHRHEVGVRLLPPGDAQLHGE